MHLNVEYKKRSVKSETLFEIVHLFLIMIFTATNENKIVWIVALNASVLVPQIVTNGKQVVWNALHSASLDAKNALFQLMTVQNAKANVPAFVLVEIIRFSAVNESQNVWTVRLSVLLKIK